MKKQVNNSILGQPAGSGHPGFASPSTAHLAQHVRRIISRRKGIRLRQLHLHTSLDQELAFDTVDLVDIILELEHHFQLTIPDEVPLHTVGDLVRYVGAHLPHPTFAVAA